MISTCFRSNLENSTNRVTTVAHITSSSQMYEYTEFFYI